MFDEFLKKILIILAWCGIFLSAGSFLLSTLEATTNKQTIETTTAKPIYQRPIGDEAEPDLLIIYEAEVEGVKVYPSVIKESE
ncbi:hypothetical protein [Jeotgalibaca porci]|uniref:hypothetical protein n=1 Tax=Jeotgalibaca porci TaxID=1868793 RepID=UPI0035A1B233